MTQEDARTFAKGMLLLGETFNEPVSEMRIDAYFEALSDLPIETVSQAVRLALKACRFFPRPVELREMVEGTAAGNADAAWGEVLTEVRRVGYVGVPRFTDARTERAVRETWGGWQQLCQTLPGEGPELIGWAKQFRACWLSQDTREVSKRLEPGTLDPTLGMFIASERARLKARHD